MVVGDGDADGLFRVQVISPSAPGVLTVAETGDNGYPLAG
jgi:hypothetical protein